MFKILITDPISDQGLKILEHDQLEIIYKPEISEDELEVLLIRSDVGVDATDRIINALRRR